MSKRQELATTKALVKSILEQDKMARNSDSYLYLKVLDAIDKEKKIGIHNIPIGRFLLFMHDWGFPPFETVRRTRQFIQRKFPDLDACEDVQAFREENQVDFKDFARGAI